MKKFALIAIALSIPAFVAQASDDSIALFAKLDADSNGLLSIDEAQMASDIAEMFSVLDADADGNLSLSEFQSRYSN